MTGITIKLAAELCGGFLTNRETENTELGKIAIDSREIKPGDIFAAFKGEKADGHDYIDTAFNNGAACCLASRIPEGENRPLIIVESVEKAMEDICAGFRKNLNIPIIGITGSVGKTSAKEMIASVLSQRFSVHKTAGNLNNTLGVPMTISQIEPTHQCAVIEMGISDFGEMSRLSNMVRPDIGLFTIIGKAHLEFLHNREGVFKAKTEMLPYLSQNGSIIINGDDDLLNTLSSDKKLIRFGLGESCDIRAVNIVKDDDSNTSCTVIYPEGSFEVKIPAYGEHMIYAALEGAAVGLSLGLSEKEIQEGIANYETVGRRAALLNTGKLTLIDDSYNANPDSVMCGIDSLVKLPGRKVCILGDMLELGEAENQMHYDCGEYAVKKGVSLVLTSGELSKHTALGAGQRGIHFESREALIAALPELIKEGDCILVKASRRSKFEEVSEALKNF